MNAIACQYGSMEFFMQTTGPQDGYELLDSGEGEKLERFGAYILARPDPQALWHKKLDAAEWEAADASFHQKGTKGSWKARSGIPQIPNSWEAEIGGFKFSIELSPFKHTGVFPEQAANWKWIGETIGNAGRPLKVLNLFGYTGGATLAAAQAGAEVVHVDASKSSIARARRNAELSGLSGAPIRWINDDAHKFAAREARRGSFYDGIILDPPAYGRGAKGELWKLEGNLLPLLASCAKIFSKNLSFILLNGYASGFSAVAYKNALEPFVGGKGGKLEAGELALQEKSGRLLSAGIFARWSR